MSSELTPPANQSVDSIRQQLLRDAAGLIAKMQYCYRWRALLMAASCVAAIALCLLGLDMILRREEFGLRVLFTLTLWSVFLGAGVGWVLPAFRTRFSPLQLAHWIERAQPELGERLSTAIQLAAVPQEDSRFGSPDFRATTFRDWGRHASQVQWGSLIDHSSWVRPLAMLGITILALSVLWLARPDATNLAMMRLLSPWSDSAWPQKDQLDFVDLPTVVAIGQELQVEVRDLSPPLPDTVEILMRPTSADRVREVTVYPTKRIGESAIASLPSMEQAIEVRAVGGDDQSMGWKKIDVTQAPKLQNFYFRIQPPDYVGRPPSDLIGNRIQVYSGSRVELVGKFADPVAGLSLIAVRNPADNQNIPSDTSIDATKQRVVQLSEDKQNFSAVVCDQSTSSGSYHWRLRITTVANLTVQSSDLWSIEVTDDSAPKVNFAELEQKQVTPQAYVPLQMAATDDLGLTKVTLHWRLENQPEDTAEQQVVHPEASTEQASPRELSWNRQWHLVDQLDSVSGQKWVLWFEATDTRGQVGRSQSQTIEILDSERVLETLAARQSQLLEQLRTLAESQRRNAQLTTRSRDILEQSQSIRSEEVDALSNVAQMQQALNRQLNSESSSVLSSLRNLSRIAKDNGLENSPLAQELQNLEKTVEKISTDQLRSALENAQTTATMVRKLAASASTPDPAIQNQLARSTETQQAAVEALEGLTDRLAHKEALRVVERELAQVLSQQQTLRQETDNLELRRLSGLTKEEFQAERAGLEADQQGLATSIEQLQKRSRALIDATPADQADIRNQLERSLQTLIEEQVSTTMRDASASLGESRFADASQSQLQASESLRKAMQQLTPSSERSVSSQLAQQQVQSEAIERLADQQAALANDFSNTNNPQVISELARRQSQLQQATEDQQDRAAQMGNSTTQKSLDDALEHQSAAADAANKNNTANASQQAQQAAESLKEAAQQAKDRTEQLEREVAQQQLMNLQSALDELVNRQKPVSQELDQAAQIPAEEMPDAKREQFEHQIRQLASRQEAIRQSVRDVRQQSDKLPAFNWTLEQAELDMVTAVAASERFRLAPDAVEAARSALKKLQFAASALAKAPQSGDSEPEAQQASDRPPENSKEQTKPIPPLASLKLLRSIQADINEQTRQLEQSADASNASDVARRRQQIAEAQFALGLQLEQILRELNASESKP